MPCTCLQPTMVLSTYAKQRILAYHSAGLRAPNIKQKLQEEGITVSRVGVWKFLCKYKRTGTLAKLEGGGRRSKITNKIKQIINQQLLHDDETTAYQMHKMLTEKGIDISIATILRCRKQLGWTFRGSAYCQLIRNVNKLKRLEWAKLHLNEAEDGFADVVWSDESSIQMETHKRYCYRKQDSPPKNKPRSVLIIIITWCTYIHFLICSGPNTLLKCMCGLALV